jgi:hypothetical protein
MLFASLPFLPLVFSGMGFIFSKSDFQGIISSNMLCVSSRDFCGGRLAGGLGFPVVIDLCFLAGRVKILPFLFTSRLFFCTFLPPLKF